MEKYIANNLNLKAIANGKYSKCSVGVVARVSCLPVKTSKMVIPNDQMSLDFPGFERWNASGGMYSRVP